MEERGGGVIMEDAGELEGGRQKAGEALVGNFVLGFLPAGVMTGGPGLKDTEQRAQLT